MTYKKEEEIAKSLKELDLILNAINWALSEDESLNFPIQSTHLYSLKQVIEMIEK